MNKADELVVVAIQLAFRQLYFRGPRAPHLGMISDLGGGILDAIAM